MSSVSLFDIFLDQHGLKGLKCRLPIDRILSLLVLDANLGDEVALVCVKADQGITSLSLGHTSTGKLACDEPV
jgi:hypothetical protein